MYNQTPQRIDKALIKFSLSWKLKSTGPHTWQEVNLQDWRYVRDLTISQSS